MEVIDSKRTCKISGCKNLGEYDRVKNGKLYRRRLCSSHKREEHGQPRNERRRASVERWKISQGNKCKLCGWKGPCDIHRIIPRKKGGRYLDGNMILICPNCHRLEHYKKKEFKGIKNLDLN